MAGVSHEDVKIVNIVGVGSLGVEIDLEPLSADILEAEYNPANYHGMYLRFTEDSPLVTVYRSGKYIITGAGTTEELFEIRSKVLDRFEEIGIIPDEVDDGFSIQNFVCQADTGRTVNLSAAAIGLGLERTEYEPEQFPGLVYRPDEYDCVLLLFGSGKVVITGASDIDVAQEAFDDLFAIIKKNSY
jgi:transcription initiation factor TFIID TATA-box-binding protein